MPDAEIAWRVYVTRQARHAYVQLPVEVKSRVRRAVMRLWSDARPAQSRKLVAQLNRYRIRVGDWRIIYKVDDDTRLVIVENIRTRGAAYE